ncbi:MAG: phytoene/squalene synthase family protein [Verrucomicrobiae bacterium]|nr:phytoene/squalene synthase family protein [Verrucomicrobiae bacterium]
MKLDPSQLALATRAGLFPPEEVPGRFGGSFEACRRLTRHHAKSFYFSSVALPEKKKYAAYAVYAFCRFADDRIDRAVEEKRDLAGAETELKGILAQNYAGQGGEVWSPAFWLTVREYDIPEKYFEDLLRGVLRDRGPVRIRTWEDLHDYCYHVASVVGLMMSKIFGLRDPAAQEQAIQMGVAMQLTNIARDVREDMLNDRIYIPATELERFGVTEEQLRQGLFDENFRALMRFQVDRARDHYTRAEPGIRHLADDGSQLTVWIMSTVYAGILDEIERVGYDVFRGRVHTGFFRKLWLLFKAWLRKSRTLPADLSRIVRD